MRKMLNSKKGSGTFIFIVIIVALFIFNIFGTIINISNFLNSGWAIIALLFLILIMVKKINK